MSAALLAFYYCEISLLLKIIKAYINVEIKVALNEGTIILNTQE